MADGQEPANSPAATTVQPAAQAADPESIPSSIAVAPVLRRQWKKENLLEKCMLLFRALCCLFSFISFIVMASNKHDVPWQNFDKYQAYKYLLAVAILAFVYTMGQVAYQVYRLSTDRFLIPRRAMGILDFAADQVTAYLLISASSAAILLTNDFRDVIDNLFTDSAAASISMAFLAFFSISLSALISGYKLSTQKYI